MPANKNALLRYRIIDNCLTNKLRTYPNIEAIQEKIQDQLDEKISISMINKDFAEMKNIYKAPIKYCRFNKGYYYTEADFSIRGLALTEKEIEALDFSTALLNQLKGTKLLEQFENAINKVIEGYRISKVIGKSEKQLIQMEAPVTTEGTERIEKILQAITYRNVLSITYQAFDKAEKVHALSPYLLKEYRNRWYVIGHSDRAKKVLVMALDRINNLNKSTDKFITSDDFNAEDFFKFSFGITQIHDVKPESVILSFTPLQAQYILKHPLHHSQKIILQNQNEVRVELYVYISAELVMTVLGYGDQVRVLEPQSLKDKIKGIITNVLTELNSEKSVKENFIMDFG